MATQRLNYKINNTKNTKKEYTIKKLPKTKQQFSNEVHLFFNKQSISDPRPENCLSFSNKSPQKIVYQLFSRWFINFYQIFKHSERRNSSLQGHLKYVMHT